jgi:hypothetical protein
MVGGGVEEIGRAEVLEDSQPLREIRWKTRLYDATVKEEIKDDWRWSGKVGRGLDLHVEYDYGIVNGETELQS